MALFEQLYPPVVSFGVRNLSGGETGTDVAVLQILYNQGAAVMTTPIGSPVTVTGKYDAATIAAVRAVQSYFSLSVDGIVGPNTYFVFGQGVGPNVTYGGPRYGSRTLSSGMSGGDVTVQQNRLNTFRYSSALGHPASGSFGANTVAAVKQFQTDANTNGDTGVPVNGVVGAPTGNATWIYTYAGGRNISPGRNGFDVVFVQLLLHKLGVYSGSITGMYDVATQAAVRAFQTAQGISVDGVVGPTTFYRLGLSNPVSAPSPMPIPPLGTGPRVSVCSAPLGSATSDLHPYGVASLVINLAEGFESIDVVGNILPDPSTLGSQYGQYAFQVTNPSTGTVQTFLMTELPTSGDWGGSYSPGVKTIVASTVQVVPTPTGSATGPFGPAVLTGNLSGCMGSSDGGSGSWDG